MDSVRIDRWLWCARLFKSRSAAAEAVRGGHVQVESRRGLAAIEEIAGETAPKPVQEAGLPAVARENFNASEGWCAQHDSNVRPPGS